MLDQFRAARPILRAAALCLALIFAFAASSPAVAQATCDTTGGLGPATAPGIYSFACGDAAEASGVQSTAIGTGAETGGSSGTAIGSFAGFDMTGTGNSVVGGGSINPDAGDAAPFFSLNGAGHHTAGNGNSAFGAGTGTYVVGDGNSAYGADSGRYITGTNNTAIGAGAGSGTFDDRRAISNSTSIGAGAQAVRDNQMAFGTAANTYTMAGIKSAASTAAQAGATYLATTDANGNMAATAFTTEELVATVGQSTAANIAQDASIAILADGLIDNTNAIGELDGRVGALENNSAALSNQISETRTEARQGIAAAIAMANPGMPSAPGKTTWATNVGYFKGAMAFGGALTYRFDTPAPTAFSLGYSYGGGESHAARVGLQGEF